jgi:hypothetical protein
MSKLVRISSGDGKGKDFKGLKSNSRVGAATPRIGRSRKAGAAGHANDKPRQKRSGDAKRGIGGGWGRGNRGNGRYYGNNYYGNNGVGFGEGVAAGLITGAAVSSIANQPNYVYAPAPCPAGYLYNQAMNTCVRPPPTIVGGSAKTHLISDRIF